MEFLRSILASKDVRSLLIALISAVLTAITDAITQAASGASWGVWLPAIMAAWSVAVANIQRQVIAWIDPPLKPDVNSPQPAPDRLDVVLGPAEVETLPYLPKPVQSGYDSHKLPILLAFLLFPSVAFASAPKAVIDGPSSVRVAGQKLVLRAADTTVATSKGYRWTINPEVKGMEQLTIIDGGKAVMVHTIPGRYVVTLVVAGSPDADGSIEIDSITHDLLIPGEAPCPPPEPTPIPPQPIPPTPPGPVPTPTPLPPVPPVPVPVPIPPVVPPGEFNISPQVAVIVSKIPSPNRVSEAKQLADAADALAAEIAAGTVTNATVVLTRIGAGIKALNSPAWVAAAPEFAALMQATWQAHSKDRLKLTTTGGIVDASGWSTLLREVAIGARGVK